MDGQSQPRWVFGQFEVDLESGELRRAGLRLALQGKPIEVLAALLAEPGRVVTRERLRRELWSDDLYGDVDHRLNNAVNRLRTALGDSASNPRFVETVPRRGYRFIAPIRALGAAASSPVARPRNHSPATAATAAAAILLVAVGAIAALRLESPGVTVEQSAQPQVEYLKGRHLWAKKEPEAVLRSRDYFLAAIEHDPSDGLAWTGLADAYNFMGGIGLMPRGEAYERATQAAETALDQDAGLGEAYASLAEARFRLGPDDEEVEPLFR
ncbi:MAG: winged helix-turn-helix domain-containing protein, partial [Acidobacteriota bacterium]